MGTFGCPSLFGGNMIEFYAVHEEYGGFRFWSISRDSVIPEEVCNIGRSCGIDIDNENSLYTLLEMAEMLGIKTSLKKVYIQDYIDNCSISPVATTRVKLAGSIYEINNIFTRRA